MARILAIDDEIDMLILIKNIFQRSGHEVEVLENPLLLNESKLHLYDLILLDIMMPGMDGIDLLKMIRSKVDCPILFLTAKTMQRDLVEGLTSGADDYVYKPFGAEELKARINAHLRREKRQRHNSINLGNIRFNLNSMETFIGEKK